MTTVKGRLFPSDEKDRYFHIYFDEGKRAAERKKLEEKIDRLAELLKKQEGTATDALATYKSRDGSEKLFSGDKSYLGDRSYRVHSTECK